MSSPYYVPAGPEAAPTSPSQSLTPTTQSSSSNSGLSPASTASIAVFLSLFGLAVLAIALCWVRRRQTATRIVNERPLDKAVVGDIEALTATHPIIPVLPLPDVRWTPQIRSISGPIPDEDSDRKFATLPPKRARSPPSYHATKLVESTQDSCPKSAPAYTLSFSQNDTPSYSEKSSRGGLSPVVSPRALAVSALQTRSLGTRVKDL